MNFNRHPEHKDWPRSRLAMFRKEKKKTPDTQRTSLVAVVMKRMRMGEVKLWPQIERPLKEQEATAPSNY